MKSRRAFTCILLAVGAGLRAGPAGSAAEPFEVTTAVSPAPPAHRQARAHGYRVSSFEIKSRWSGVIALPLREGDLWTPEKQSAALEAIRAAFNSETAFSHLLSQASTASVLYIDVEEEKDEAAHTVRLTFRPLQVRLSLAKMGDNLLPIPRSPSPTRYELVPKPLLALNPVFGVTHDRAFGTAATLGIQSDLLPLVSPPDNASHLEARLHGSKSVENFHRLNAAVAYAHRRLGETIQNLSASAGYDEAREPLASEAHTARSGRVDGSITLRLANRTRLTCDVGFALVNDGVTGSVANLSTRTQVVSNRLLVESQLPASVGGFFRAALWEESGRTDHGFGSHQRLVLRTGYAREFSLSPNQTVGVELVAGGGKLWGRVPESRRYFGGNSAAQFLYDDAAATTLRNLPPGPLIRSFGQNAALGAAGRAGGDGFWHVNANLALPIRALSFPLIPADDEVRGMLRNGINVSGRSFLITTLKGQGLSPTAARAEADRILGEIRPATDYIVNEANFYALKPLLMFDAAGLSGAAGKSTWSALGGGIQLTVVTAKFELGYMRTLTGPTGGRQGNLSMRLVFQNLF